jgi:hypothetical protein
MDMMACGICLIQMKGEIERRKILDWYHWMENLGKVGESLKRLAQARFLLWQGTVGETLSLFEGCKKQRANSCSEFSVTVSKDMQQFLSA